MSLVEVRVPCPSGHHPDHAIFLAPTISLAGAIEAEQALLDAADKPNPQQAVTYAWAPIFVRHGARDWDLCDGNGGLAEFDINAILDDYSLARVVANKADEIGYGRAVIAPLLDRRSKPSRTGQTPDTTSATPPRTRKRSGSR